MGQEQPGRDTLAPTSGFPQSISYANRPAYGGKCINIINVPYVLATRQAFRSSNRIAAYIQPLPRFPDSYVEARCQAEAALACNGLVIPGKQESLTQKSVREPHQ